MASPTLLKRCPACNARLVPDKPACPSCAMPAAKMADFAAAKRVAEARGIGKTAVEKDVPARSSGGAIPYVKYTLCAGVGLVLIGLAYFVVSYWTRPAPQPWLAYPTSAKDLVAQILTDIHTDTDPSADHALTYLSLARRSTDKETQQHDHFHQLFHDMAKYLTGEFGPDWINKVDIQPADPAKGGDETTFVVKIATDTIHVQLETQQPPTPAGGAAPPALKPPHFGFISIPEFDTDDTARSAQLGIINAVIGQGSARQLGGIMALSGNQARETPMDTKRRILPILRNPHDEALKRIVYHAWPVRLDPTVRARLKSIIEDQRYAMDVQKVAQQVLDSSVPEEELISAGVQKFD